jgi:hypothetical protein
MVEIGVDALDAGLAAVVREGLASDAEVDPDAARALGRGSGEHTSRLAPRAAEASQEPGLEPESKPEPESGREQEIGRRP